MAINFILLVKMKPIDYKKKRVLTIRIKEFIRDVAELLNMYVQNKNYAYASYCQGKIEGLKTVLTVIDTIEQTKEEDLDAWITYEKDVLNNSLVVQSNATIQTSAPKSKSKKSKKTTK